MEEAHTRAQEQIRDLEELLRVERVSRGLESGVQEGIQVCVCGAWCQRQWKKTKKRRRRRKKMKRRWRRKKKKRRWRRKKKKRKYRGRRSRSASSEQEKEEDAGQKKKTRAGCFVALESEDAVV